MPAEHHEVSVVTYLAQKTIGPMLDPYAGFVEGLADERPGLAKFLGLGGFVQGGHVQLPDHAVMATFVVALLMVVIPLLRRGLSIDRPSHGQQVLEMLVQALRDMLDDVVGHHSHKYLPLIGNFAVFIFVANFMGLLPGMTAPTSNLNVTFSLGLFSFVYYNAMGFREMGPKYLAHFFGPVAFMAPLMFVIEVFSHMFRPVSLAIRLYGNMNGEHILGGVFLNDLGPFPFLYPVLVMALGLFTCLLQSYIFVMLSMVYIAGAVAHEH